MRLGWLSGVHLDEDGLTFIDGDDDPVPAHCKSPMLTCWRKLHVEVDSMGAETNVSSGNSETVGTNWLTVPGTPWVNDELIGCRLNPNTGQGQTFVITDNVGDTATVPPGSGMDQVASSEDPYKIDFVDFEEDDDLRGDIPSPDTSKLADVFDDCYIAVEVGTQYDSASTPWCWRFNSSETAEGSYCQKHSGSASASNYWSVYVLGGYEPSDQTKDNDEDDEACADGASFGVGSDLRWAIVYFEVLRDEKEDQWLWSAGEYTHAHHYIVCHEVGNLLQLEDNGDEDGSGSPTNVMWAAENNAEEDKRPLVAFVLLDSDIDAIRGTTAP